MTDLSYREQQAIVKELNATPLSQHLENLLRKEGAEILQDSLMVVNLLAWAAENHFTNKLVGEEVLGAAGVAEERNPEAVYDNLTDEMDDMMEATSLEEASMKLVRNLLEIPAFR